MTNEEQILFKLDNIANTNSGINDQLKILNGRMGKVEKRVRDIENDDIRQEGIREGKTAMKASTKTIIVVILTGFGCLFTGVTMFKSSEAKLVKSVTIGMSDRFTGAQAKIVNQTLEKLKREVENLKRKNGDYVDE